MRTKLSVGVLVVGLLLSGLLTGAAHRGRARTATTQTIELRSPIDPLSSAGFPLTDSEGKGSGQIDLFKEQLLDADGNEVGIYRLNCMNARAIGWFCSGVMSLRAGPYTDHGQVVITGMFRGFNGESFAVIGGTGAYDNAGGHATLTIDGEDLVRTLYLEP